MPSVTVVGSGANPVNFVGFDAYSYAQNAALQITAAITSGSVVNPYTGTPFSAVTAPSGQGVVDVFSAVAGPLTSSGTSAAVLLNTNANAVVDSLSTFLSLQGGGPSETVIAGSGGLSYTTFSSSAAGMDSIVAGDGANFIQTATVGGGFYSVNTGSGNDSINALTGNSTINAGTGKNFIQLGSGNNYIYSEGFDSITGNTVPGAVAGTDTVNIGSGQATINPVNSNFFIYGNQFNSLTLLKGSGSDTVSVGKGGGSVVGGSAGNNYLFGGVGGAGSAGTTIVGGGAGDHLFAIGGGSITAIAGAGAETITGAINPAGFGTTASTGNNLFEAGSGNDSLQAGGGADTLQGGTGSAVLSSGTGADTFLFTNGSSGGSDTITGFKAADTLQLSGYGLNSATALNTALSSGSNTVLTLGDGTTITLSNVSLTSQQTLPLGTIKAS